MEVEAARDALARAGITADEIDVLITHAMVPDYMCVNHASIVQDKLGLRKSALCFGIEVVCSSFLVQLRLAAQFIHSGAARRVLVTQSSACTRLMPAAEPYAAWLGDAATAVVVGPGDG